MSAGAVVALGAVAVAAAAAADAFTVALLVSVPAELATVPLELP